jgi:hypothetical protein
MAPQLTPMNGLSARGLARWIACASTSFPVPDSPNSSALASDSATSLARRSRSSIFGLRVTMPVRQLSPLLLVVVVAGPESFAASATFCSNAWLSNGLVRKPNTPRSVALTASGIVPCAVRMMNRQRRMRSMDRLEQRHAVDARHLQIGDDDVRPRDRQRRQRSLTRFCGMNRVARGRQTQADQLQQIRVIVD